MLYSQLCVYVNDIRIFTNSLIKVIHSLLTGAERLNNISNFTKLLIYHNPINERSINSWDRIFSLFLCFLSGLFQVGEIQEISICRHICRLSSIYLFFIFAGFQNW